MKRRFLSVSLLSLSISSVAFAAGQEAGTVRFEHGQHSSGPNSAGLTFFYLEGATKIGSPACATYDNGERWVINNNWPAAKIQIATLLTAAVAGKQVQVFGSGDCSNWGNTETAVDIRIGN